MTGLQIWLGLVGLSLLLGGMIVGFAISDSIHEQVFNGLTKENSWLRAELKGKEADHD
jgi:hypothetical protein